MTAGKIMIILLGIATMVGLTQVSFEFQVMSSHEQMTEAQTHGDCQPTPPEDCIQHCFNQAQDRQPDNNQPLPETVAVADAPIILVMGGPTITTKSHQPQIFPPPKISTILSTQIRS